MNKKEWVDSYMVSDQAKRVDVIVDHILVAAREHGVLTEEGQKDLYERLGYIRSHYKWVDRFLELL